MAFWLAQCSWDLSDHNIANNAAAHCSDDGQQGNAKKVQPLFKSLDSTLDGKGNRPNIIANHQKYIKIHKNLRRLWYHNS